MDWIMEGILSIIKFIIIGCCLYLFLRFMNTGIDLFEYGIKWLVVG